MPRTRSRIRPLVENHIPQLARPLGKMMLRSLVQGRHLLGGDLDKLLVLGSIAMRMADHPDYTSLTVEEMVSRVEPLPSLSVSVQSISVFTEIPRESVRRKVGELIEAGWVERIEEGNMLRLSVAGYARIHPLRDNFIGLVTECVVAVEQLQPAKALRKMGATN